MKDENKDHGVQKAKIEIVLGKSAKFDFLMTTAVTAAMTPAMTTVLSFCFENQMKYNFCSAA
ncbi:hypothetical protein CFP56_025312 [Quercus suber]|uniref:Uncharacterized protein n=1 Tax=Quercus suber TaxID=58331 RepID=A0AAW0K3Q2_QUESU